ncbi:hypothetical protein [Streptomyces venezuelae]|uniref:Uncharacterized protein n=1 Tax=Streptomyces venezuelae TaxID=54571 RepID=A0A5P2BFM0_STRVZ|nr:hypothetical protein [Streptomyces venezuelae]QES29176.1 hypothetical protein DEJ47_24520 [Streptomyces venezuelae]
MEEQREATTVLAHSGEAWREAGVQRITEGGAVLCVDADAFEFHLTLSLDYTERDFQWGVAQAAALDLALIPETEEEAELIGDGPDFVRIHLVPTWTNQKEPPIWP